ncbi:MAG: hypothetical protein M3Q08_05365 [Pseudomonadota bacterium]|nr:hypothetical protein [Pseudomonadota bacterium]
MVNETKNESSGAPGCRIRMNCLSETWEVHFSGRPLLPDYFPDFLFLAEASPDAELAGDLLFRPALEEDPLGPLFAPASAEDLALELPFALAESDFELSSAFPPDRPEAC